MQRMGKQQTEQDIFWYDHLTAQQIAAKDELARILTKQGVHLHDEFVLLRFLRARQWDVVKAEAMLKEMLRWRRENNVDSLLDDFSYPEQRQVLTTYPHFYHKTDKWGRPVYIELCGELDIQKFGQDYYPEHLGAMFIINAPIVFRGIWSVIRPWLDERTAKKIQVLGTDYHSQLHAVIPEENLLARFGGKSTIADISVEVGPWSEPAIPEKKIWEDSVVSDPVKIQLSAIPATAAVYA